ncbi:hypothetical protein [Thiosulfativibrio zosterae]|uniref:Uroporphyrinogen-III C-methyltransferase n=1 Tax=Thiosulfativibrio zosterae TaxID=2675053 RepID=A0A6F8PJV1_9GAMM|nr:hypothetical protein [Thiosulfativibrio zosterae]BBP42375.1 hypothetical protein THMIRHAT_01210 [Thiosulfativibrio zosterae]
MKSETITPKANRRILDAQLVDEEPRADSRPFDTFHQESAASKSTKNPEKNSVLSALLPQKFSDYLQLILGFSVLLLILVLWLKQKDQDWQIEQINQLQSQVAQLSHVQETLQSKQSDLQQSLEAQQQAALALENKPLVSQADLENLKSQLKTLESQVTDFSLSAQSQAKTVLDEAQKTLQDWLANQSLAKPNDESLPEAVQQRLQSMGQQLTDLFAFKDQQLAQKAPEKTDPLSEMQLQKWILEINTQWLLAGNIVQTQQRLQALEQAAGLSDFSQKMHLMRLIGEDLARLDNLNTTMATALWKPEASSALKVWLSKQSQQKQAANPENTALKMPLSEESNIQTPETLSPWQRLQQAFASVFTVKKRESDQDLTRVEQSLMQDVLLQRAYLWVEQLDWAMQSGSEIKKQQALTQLNTYVSQYWPTSNQAELDSLLQPYESVQFKALQPLSVVNAL